MRRYIAELITKAAILATSKKNTAYVGVMLLDSKPLIRWWEKNVGSLHSTVNAHHMTVEVNPKDGNKYPLGKHVELKVLGFAHDDKVQVVVVKGFWSKNKVAHVTVAVADGVNPVYSNDLLRKGWEKLKDGPTLSGRLGYSDGKTVHYERQ